jgi:hypothetical protein
MLCGSCKNKTSTERCPAKALKNLQFCGKHAKSKNPRLWSEANSADPKAILIQKIWRGWITRYRIDLAGPGVLNRKICHNEEDVITFVERDKIHPLNYFAFFEDNKVFCFDIRSIFQLSIDHLKPTNPYTRQELSLDTRKRMKECIYYRELRLLPLFHDPLYLTDQDKVFGMRWMMISQMLEESLFIDINPMFFIALNRTQLWEFTAMLRNSLLLWAKEHTSVHSRRNIYYVWVHTCWKRQTLEVANTKQVCHYLGGCLLKILKDSKQPYDACFKILSARHSL